MNISLINELRRNLGIPRQKHSRQLISENPTREELVNDVNSLFGGETVYRKISDKYSVPSLNEGKSLPDGTTDTTLTKWLDEVIKNLQPKVKKLLFSDVQYVSDLTIYPPQADLNRALNALKSSMRIDGWFKLHGSPLTSKDLDGSSEYEKFFALTRFYLYPWYLSEYPEKREDQYYHLLYCNQLQYIRRYATFDIHREFLSSVLQDKPPLESVELVFRALIDSDSAQVFMKEYGITSPSRVLDGLEYIKKLPTWKISPENMYNLIETKNLEIYTDNDLEELFPWFTDECHLMTRKEYRNRLAGVINGDLITLTNGQDIHHGGYFVDGMIKFPDGTQVFVRDKRYSLIENTF